MTDSGIDPLSPLARRLIAAGRYDLLVGPSRAPAEARRLLDGVSPDQLLTVPAAAPAAAHALLAGLWRWHDGLHECHDVVQKSPDDRRLSAPLSPPAGASADRPGPTPGRPPSTRELTATFAYWHACMRLAKYA